MDADPDRTLVTIDGPAGAGKSTTARAVARRLGYGYLDSGALYRALTFALQRAGIPESRWDALDRADLNALEVAVEDGPETLILRHRGRELGSELRTPEVTAAVSSLARLPVVRSWLLDTQRDLGRRGRLVADGRDMGTVVFPHAATKVFLDADPAERARRRLGDQGVDDPPSGEIEAEAERLLDRDRRDRERHTAPLKPAPDAWVLDTTALSFDEQVDAIVERAREAAGRGRE